MCVAASIQSRQGRLTHMTKTKATQDTQELYALQCAPHCGPPPCCTHHIYNAKARLRNLNAHNPRRTLAHRQTLSKTTATTAAAPPPTTTAATAAASATTATTTATTTEGELRTQKVMRQQCYAGPCQEFQHELGIVCNIHRKSAIIGNSMLLSCYKGHKCEQSWSTGKRGK